MQKGDPVAYRSFAGDVYDAMVTNVRDAGFVDIDVLIPGVKKPFPLHAVRYNEEPAQWARAGPREKKSGESKVERSE